MKNRVNISKLIREKYREDTVSVEEFNEIIDSVLQESYPNYEYPRNPAYIMQDNARPQSQIVADIVNGPTGDGAPRHDISTDINGNIRDHEPKVSPDKIAESEGTLSTVRQRTMTVPDLFSMITDPKKMSVGSPDRELINNIIANIGLQQTSSWREKIDKLQQHIYKLTIPSEQPVDITQVISALIFLNLFKKLSFFMDHPGKQFEYLFLPFLSPTAEVKGDEAREITDVVFDGKEYSLKFLSSQQPTVRGSRANINAKIAQSNYSMTLVARVIPSGIIEFAEFGITDDPDFVVQNYKIISGQAERSKSLWFESKAGGSSNPRFMCLLDANRQNLSNVEVGVEKTKEKKLGGSIGGRYFSEDDFKKLKQDLNKFEGDIKTEKPGSDKYNKAIQDIAKEFPIFSQLIQNPNDRKQILKFLGKEEGGIRNQLNNAEQKINVARGLQASVQKEAKVQQQVSSGQFEVSVQGIWPTIVIKKLNLGNPEVYNKQLGFVAGQISNFYVDMLNSLDELNKNITNYVATSSDTQKSTGSQTYAFKCVKNAGDIQKNVLDIEKKKKT